MYGVSYGHNAAHPRIQPPLEAAAQTGIEFDLLDLLLVIAERKYTIILTTLIGLFLGMGVVMLCAPHFYCEGDDHAPPAGAVQRRPG